VSLGREFVREQGTSSVPDYRKRVARLAAIYASTVLACVAAITLIIVKGRLFVTLSQRSNVETLTLAFIILLFTYLAAVSLPGFWGAITIVVLNAPAWVGRDESVVEQRKQRALKPKTGDPNSVQLNCRVYLRGDPDSPISIPLQDDYGSLGRIVIDGTRMSHLDALQSGSNSLFAFVERRIQDLVRQHDPGRVVEIVQWTSIDDEQAEQYHSLVTFARNLERELRTPPLWPAVELTDDDIQTLTNEARRLVPVLRNEARLPDLEYEVEHRLPIIPEPLAFIALSRHERRADPVASMGCALVVALLILSLVALIIVFPPWVPSK
jgi:hypothetical protein